MPEIDNRTPLHYESSYQHWDLAIKIPLGYLEGCTTKHVSRWRKKLGIQDLQKAMHYLDKLIEVATYDIKRNNVEIDKELRLFVEANNLTHLEYQYLFILCTYRNVGALKNARQILTKILMLAIQERNLKAKEEQNVPGTPEDGGHHSRYTEPK
jgi:hypothetical protein